MIDRMGFYRSRILATEAGLDVAHATGERPYRVLTWNLM
jgi:hypothetical protein